MSELVAFQLGKSSDYQGRFIKDIWQLSNFWLEHDHKYVQWLFPIDTQTKFNSHAPVLTPFERDAFSNSECAMAAQRRSLDMMLHFFGLQWADEKIIPVDDINLKDYIWLKHGGHNHYRISRIIRSLALCGQLPLSKPFQSAVLDVSSQFGEINESSRLFWLEANIDV